MSTTLPCPKSSPQAPPRSAVPELLATLIDELRSTQEDLAALTAALRDSAG